MLKKILLLAVFSIAFESFSQSTDKRTSERVGLLVNEILTVSHMPGISIAVIREGKVIYAQGFGYADIENKKPVTPETQFRTASVAKVITATGVAKLIQDNKLDLSKTVDQYVPYFPEKKYKITVAQLASHAGGIPHYSDNDKIEKRIYTSVRDGLNVFSHEDLLFQPGTSYSYSTHGYTLLSAVMEGASGVNYLDYMKKEIFIPLGMNSTGPDTRRYKANDKVAKIYSVEGPEVKEITDPEETSYKWAGGGFVTTPTDLVHMANAYFDGFIRPDVVKTMFTPQLLTNGNNTRVGIGWRTSIDIDGRKVIEHAGSMEGARPMLVMYPDQKLAIALMINAQWNSSIEEPAHMIARLFLNNYSAPQSLTGKQNIRVTVVNGKGEETTTQGELDFTTPVGKFTPDLNKKEQWSLVTEGGNEYALIRPDGVFYCIIEKQNGSVSGKAIAYGQRQDKNPIGNNPFVTFRSSK